MMDTREKLHVAAAAFANERMEQTRAYATDPYTKMEEQYVWLAHYEGFKAGVEYAHSQR